MRRSVNAEKLAPWTMEMTSQWSPWSNGTTLVAGQQRFSQCSPPLSTYDWANSTPSETSESHNWLDVFEILHRRLPRTGPTPNASATLCLASATIDAWCGCCAGVTPHTSARWHKPGCLLRVAVRLCVPQVHLSVALDGFGKFAQHQASSNFACISSRTARASCSSFFFFAVLLHNVFLLQPCRHSPCFLTS